jgi:hypothetical protein
MNDDVFLGYPNDPIGGNQNMHRSGRVADRVGQPQSGVMTGDGVWTAVQKRGVDPLSVCQDPCVRDVNAARDTAPSPRRHLSTELIERPAMITGLHQREHSLLAAQQRAYGWAQSAW